MQQAIKRILLGKWFFVIAAMTFAVSRMATWFFPYDSDHWLLYYVGKHWAQGATLYVDVWDHKTPVIYGYNALLHGLFGANLFWHRLVFTLLSIVSLYLFYQTAKLMFAMLISKNIELITRLSTLIFACLVNLSQFTNSGNTTETLGVVFLLASLWCYLLYRSHPESTGYLLASGAFAGLLVFSKLNFCLLMLPIVFDLYILHKENINKLISAAAIFLVSPLLLILAWFMYFNNQGTLKDFFTASFGYNINYIKALGWDFSATGAATFISILILLLILFGPFITRAIKEFWQPPRGLPFFVPLMALSTVLFILLVGVFYSQFYLIIIPYLCLIFGATTTANFKRKKLPKIIVMSASLLILMSMSYKQFYNNFYGQAASELKNQKAAADYIKQHTGPNDTFVAYTYGATMYQLAERSSGTRFLSASFPLIDYQNNFGYNFNTKMIVDIEVNESPYVVISSSAGDTYRTGNPVLMRYFDKNYRKIYSVGGYDILKRRQ